MSAIPQAVPFREVRHFQPDDFLHIEPIELRAHQLGWTIPAHLHEGLYQFQWLECGSALTTLDDRQVELQAPAAFLIAPRSPHAFVYSPQCRGYQVSVPADILAQRLAPLPRQQLARSGYLSGTVGEPDFAELAQLYRQLATEFERDELGRIEALQARALLIALWFARKLEAVEARSHAPSLRDTLVRRYKALLNQHYQQQQRLSFYATELQVTQDHLSRTCRAALGVSAQDLLHERLVLEARRLLIHTQLPIAELALSLGFTDPQYFSRFFSRRCGFSPSLYRQRAVEGKSVPPPEGQA